MTNSLPEALAIAAVSFIAGVIVGQFVRFRRVRTDGHTVLRPELDRRPLAGPWFRLALVGLFLAATGILVQFTVDQRHCNAEFQRTITIRADVGADDNRARKENDQAVAALVRGFLAIEPGPDAWERSWQLLEEFDRTSTENNARQEDNERRRNENPYPRC